MEDYSQIEEDAGVSQKCSIVRSGLDADILPDLGISNPVPPKEVVSESEPCSMPWDDGGNTDTDCSLEDDSNADGCLVDSNFDGGGLLQNGGNHDDSQASVDEKYVDEKKKCKTQMQLEQRVNRKREKAEGKARILQAYKSGVSLKEIAEKEGVCKQTVLNTTRKAGMPTQRELVKERIESAIEAAIAVSGDDKARTIRIAVEIAGVTERTIYNYLAKMPPEVWEQNQPPKMGDCDEMQKQPALSEDMFAGIDTIDAKGVQDSLEICQCTITTEQGSGGYVNEHMRVAASSRGHPKYDSAGKTYKSVNLRVSV